MKKLFAIALFALLSACVTPPPVSTPGDAIGQGYVAIEIVAKSVANAQASGTLEASQAAQLKAQLQAAQDAFNTAAQAPAGSDEAATALSRAQGLLNLTKLYLTHNGVKQ